ncbi:hypothetical protein ACNFJ7_02095 [Sphingomonas sp. HT-1]|uniref:hypothetical protein n=1 Tax=unclassified Sphingomonas TaxID=196159 RepID=UPI000314A587|nr:MULTISPECIES: hypothetical protein [unclassified Sphingomonas]KTF68661.1 hypothetical protein ATB93_13125 [Sphingomonas sp. WG]
MIATKGAAAAQAASASASLRAEAGAEERYPFLSHRTVAEAWPDCGAPRCVGGVWRLEDERVSAVRHEIDGFMFIPMAARVGAAEVSNG